MRSVAAIVEAAVDVQQLARAIAKEHVALQDCDRQLDMAERKTEGLRDRQRQHRVELGRLLVEAKRGVKHGGWLPYLEKLGIPPRTAQEWMELASYVDAPKSAPNPDGAHLTPPPRSKRRAAHQTTDNASNEDDLDPEVDSDDAATSDEVTSTFVPVFKRIENEITKEAMQMFPKDRQLFAAWLRNVADDIDPTR